MDQNQLNKLEQLFNKFAKEEQASNFAVNNLFNRVLSIINQKPKKKPKEDNINEEG